MLFFWLKSVVVSSMLIIFNGMINIIEIGID